MKHVVVALMLVSSPLYAAGPPEKNEADEVATETEDSKALPRSMVPQGVIGHLEAEDGYSLFDPDVLIAMRKELILRSDADQ